MEVPSIYKAYFSGLCKLQTKSKSDPAPAVSPHRGQLMPSWRRLLQVPGTSQVLLGLKPRGFLGDFHRDRPRTMKNGDIIGKCQVNDMGKWLEMEVLNGTSSTSEGYCWVTQK